MNAAEIGLILMGLGVVFLALGFAEEIFFIPAVGFVFFGLLLIFAPSDRNNAYHFVMSRASTTEEAVSVFYACIKYPPDQRISDAAEWRKGCVEGAKKRGVKFAINSNGIEYPVVTPSN